MSPTPTIRTYDPSAGWGTRPSPLTKVSGDTDTWRDHLAANGYLLSDDIGGNDDPVRFDLWEPADDRQPLAGYLLEVSVAENSQLVHCPDEVAVLELLRRWLPTARRWSALMRRSDRRRRRQYATK